MEANISDINQLDDNVLLPPRKRLLAGMKKQTLECSLRKISHPFTSSELDTYINSALSSLFNNPNLSPEEILESIKLKAIAAAKVAKAARALAEVKAAIAAKVEAAAKSALELVASICEETPIHVSYSTKNELEEHTATSPLELVGSISEDTPSDESYSTKKKLKKHTTKSALESVASISEATPIDESHSTKNKLKNYTAKSASELVASISEETPSDKSYSTKNKQKKHNMLHHLYEKHPQFGHFKTDRELSCKFGNLKADEELARKLHRDMNSSPRISKRGLNSGKNIHKYKKPKLAPSVEEKTHYKYNDNAKSGKVNSKVYTSKVNGKASKFCESNELEMGNGEAGPSYSREESRKAVDETSINVRKRGRTKLKKLPMSFCTFWDQESPIELNKSSRQNAETKGKSTTSNESLIPDTASNGYARISRHLNASNKRSYGHNSESRFR